MDVLFENQDYLILGELLEYTFQSVTFLGYSIRFIDKNMKTFQGYSITEPKYKEKKSDLIFGNCAIY